MKNQSLIVWMGRVSLFIIFFWFGLLKLLTLSPAEGLVKHLHALTLASFISPDKFMIVLGVIECWIGIMWLFPKFTKLVFIAFLLQMATTFLPLLLLPEDTWDGIALSLTGQYIVKNIALVSLALMIYLSEKEGQELRQIELSKKNELNILT